MGERGVLPASRNQTIREHLEAIVRITKGYSQNHPEEPVYKHAVAALDQLNNAVYDGPAATRMRLVPDPDPGVGAEHAPKEHP